MWPFGNNRRKDKDAKEVTGLELAVSRERTKLYSTLDTLDRVVHSPAFDLMVQRSLKLMEPKK